MLQLQNYYYKVQFFFEKFNIEVLIIALQVYLYYFYRKNFELFVI